MIDKYCPAQGNKCNKCVDLAKAAFMGTYGASHPDLNPKEITMAHGFTRSGTV